MVDRGFDLFGEVFAEGFQVFHGFEPDQLAGDVADRCAFEGEGMHRQAAGVASAMFLEGPRLGPGRPAVRVERAGFVEYGLAATRRLAQ